uniref:hypothetical protein n=1 Tax=Neobacillus sp. FSL H8-0543 TaxID=2954672 RepID=UPI00406CAE84
MGSDPRFWYYLNSGGVMQTGWEYIGGTWYYFYSGSKMVANTKIGSYIIGPSGAWIK